jgi:hypothetical protein
MYVDDVGAEHGVGRVGARAAQGEDERDERERTLANVRCLSMLGIVLPPTRAGIGGRP